MNDNNILNVQDCWLDTNIVAELKGITERAVRLSLRKKKYIFKTYDTRGGKSYKILLSSLANISRFESRIFIRCSK